MRRSARWGEAICWSLLLFIFSSCNSVPVASRLLPTTAAPIRPLSSPAPLETRSFSGVATSTMTRGSQPAMVTSTTISPTSGDVPTTSRTPTQEVTLASTDEPPTLPATVSSSLPPTPTATGSLAAEPPNAGTPIIYETSLSIETYDYKAGFVPTEPDDDIYPYPRLNFSHVGPPTLQEYRAIVLENDYVRLTILPELGGRLYGWLDKMTGRELLYQNPVIKPTSWGYRQWWLAAGGIEWSFPVEEHGLNEWQPWQTTIAATPTQATVTVSSVEMQTGMTVRVSMTLHRDHAYLLLQPAVRNGTEERHTYQFWLNAMITLGDNRVSSETRFILPADRVLMHSTGDEGMPPAGSVMGWPNHAGRDMSLYGNWSGWLSYFVPEVHSGFTAVYDPEADQGIVRIYDPGVTAGTKIFGPAGLSPTLWTDGNSNYVELWSGATATFWDDAILDPGQAVGWTEYWYPAHGLGHITFANRAAALRLTEAGGNVEVGLATSSWTEGTLILYTGEQEVTRWSVTADPFQPFRTIWTRPDGASEPLGLRLLDRQGEIIVQTGELP